MTRELELLEALRHALCLLRFARPSMDSRIAKALDAVSAAALDVVEHAGVPARPRLTAASLLPISSIGRDAAETLLCEASPPGRPRR